MRYATHFNGIPLSGTLAADPALDDHYEYSCIETPLGPKSLLLTWRLRRVDGSPFAEAAVPGLDLHRAFSRTYVALPPAPPAVWEPVWCSF